MLNNLTNCFINGYGVITHFFLWSRGSSPDRILYAVQDNIYHPHADSDTGYAFTSLPRAHSATASDPAVASAGTGVPHHQLPASADRP